MRQATTGDYERLDALPRRLHLAATNTADVLPRVATRLYKRHEPHLVLRKPPVEPRVVVNPSPHRRQKAAGPEGCEVRACETKARNVLADRPHAQGRGAADKRQSRCTTGGGERGRGVNGAAHGGVRSRVDLPRIVCSSKKNPAAFATGYCLPTRGLSF